MTRFNFFSGKGGVGKTSMAATTAVRAADGGRAALIVTTDPASNLSDVFEQPIGHHITPIAGVPNLWAMELDPDRATAEYIDRAMAPVRAAFPPQIVQVMQEQMSGPCTAEVAAFDRFVDFLEPPVDATPELPAFEVVIFDTAPTGHTLRLLELPAEWQRSIEEAEQGSGQTCIGPTAAIQSAKSKYERALVTLRDPRVTTFTFVLHPEATSIQETRRALGELARLGIHNHSLIVNGIVPPLAEGDLFARRREMQTAYLAQIERDLPVATRHMSLLDREIKGVERLREVGRLFFDGVEEKATHLEDEVPVEHRGTPADLATIQGRLLPERGTRLLFFAGKGGVGKTVAACVTAIWLARQGLKTLLLTTDPAAHLGAVLGVPVGDEVAPVTSVPGLWATKIDPKAAATAFKARILADARQRGRPEAAIAVMAEELESPCTEEMAAFDRFIEYATQPRWDVIVFDTAPTGHTLRLLELPFDWSKQLDVKVFASVDSVAADDVAKARFGQIIDMMRDPARGTFAFVMYPESTPILEAERASAELATMDIPTRLVVANLVIPPEAAATPFAGARRAMQQRYLGEIRERFDTPVVEVPLQPGEVQGIEMLAALGTQLYGEAALALLPGVHA